VQPCVFVAVAVACIYTHIYTHIVRVEDLLESIGTTYLCVCIYASVCPHLCVCLFVCVTRLCSLTPPPHTSPLSCTQAPSSAVECVAVRGVAALSGLHTYE